MIKTWEQRCEAEFDDDAIITSRDIMDKMQDEIDELRAALGRSVPVKPMTDREIRDTSLTTGSEHQFARAIERFHGIGSKP